MNDTEERFVLKNTWEKIRSLSTVGRDVALTVLEEEYLLSYFLHEMRNLKRRRSNILHSPMTQPFLLAFHKFITRGDIISKKSLSNLDCRSVSLVVDNISHEKPHSTINHQLH